MRNGVVILLFGSALLAACSVWEVNQDPAGMNYRRDANQVIWALQNYRRDNGAFPSTLAMLTPKYLPALPEIPDVRYSPADGSLRYAYIPSWPQLRPVRCASEGNTTAWHCAEHLIDRPL
ncbi:MAG: hypothetical protein JOY77_14200 [Alphaproteobacteria bacterium]|nr:hypothetical protein [Alphaproteobacteria bacterium]MBV9064059.1 hypothetical protein [Alphaproteobacteria bacterium]